MDIVWLILGLLLILGGANWLTDGASAIAKKWGVSDLIIGLTVVAFGTSTPELSIGIISALKGSAPLAIGNVVGSNIFNIFVIIGIVALIHPIKIERSVLNTQIPFVILSSIALLAIGCAPLLGVPGKPEIIRPEGILLFLFFLIFMRYTFSQAKTASSDDPSAVQASAISEMNIWKAIGLVILGLGALVFGGDRFVAGASGIASSLGMSEALIGLTIVAAGSSLPELATSIISAVKGKPGIAVGNVIGSNIFNIFMVLGITATIKPLPFGSIGYLDLLIMTVASILFWIFGRQFGDKVIDRWEGGVLVSCYLGYIIDQIFSNIYVG
ncbi:MAG: calcium/sodium antiporter [Muribaculaceae bacterium]|nr:calcium/sodium antiporter [Muribaculaceae bacterium]